MKIKSVDKESPLYGKVHPGWKLLKINGETVLDSLDCLYKLSGVPRLRLLFLTTDGQKRNVIIDNPCDLGIEFEPDKIRVCRNKCIFCFVHQQPKGMRRSLYIKDEDYTLSFTHGNFVSFSNLTESDLRRIISQKLTPLYVSVHTTDDTLRRYMFQNNKLKPIMSQLRRLTKNGIKIHTQVVVCPGINDGVHLEKTIDDLGSLYPGVQTLGVVPVGLTKYREKLHQLRSSTKNEIEDLLILIHKKQGQFIEKKKTRIVFGGDELYLKSGRELPRISEYESMEQFENGIGMMRLMITDFNRRKRFIKCRTKKRILMITGALAGPALEGYFIPLLLKKKIRVKIMPIANRFWGTGVTVSGLLTGRDILNELKNKKGQYDLAILPPNCLNNDDLFLDDMSLTELRKKAGIDIRLGKYSMVDTFNEVVS